LQPQRANFLGVFLTGKEEILLPTDKMVEILSLSLEDVLPIPETTPLAIGVFNWRQQVVWLIDLPAVLGKLSIAQQSPGLLQRDVVVVNYQGQMLGLGIARVGKIHSSESASQLEVPILDVKSVVGALAGNH
jgi:chemotaxis signal transduction protein